MFCSDEGCCQNVRAVEKVATSLDILSSSCTLRVARKNFTNVTERVLLRSSSGIKRFDLVFHVLGDASLVNLWVSAAVKRNVEVCFVHLSEIPGNFAWPCGLFSCATLTRLNLSISGALKLPSRIWIPNLGLLHLENIMFVDDRSTEQLLSSPVLEELTLDYCTWDNHGTLTIRAPMLKILTAYDEDFDCSSVHRYGCWVLIYGNNLEGIFCLSPFLNDYRIKKSCLLLRAYINVPYCCPSRTGQVAYRLNKLLEGTCAVNRLTMSSKAVDVLSSAADLHSHLPIFPKLKELNLGRLDFKHQVIVKLLHNSPNLEELEFTEGIELYPSGEEDVAILDPAPRCFGSHLRQIKLSDVLLCEKEVRVLKPLLKHAVVLEKLVIWSAPDSLFQGIKEMFHEKLLEIRCGSKSLEIAIFKG